MEEIAYQNGWSKEEFQKRIDARISILQELAAKDRITVKDMETAVNRLAVEEMQNA